MNTDRNIAAEIIALQADRTEAADLVTSIRKDIKARPETDFSQQLKDAVNAVRRLDYQLKKLYVELETPTDEEDAAETDTDPEEDDPAVYLNQENAEDLAGLTPDADQPEGAAEPTTSFDIWNSHTPADQKLTQLHNRAAYLRSRYPDAGADDQAEIAAELDDYRRFARQVRRTIRKARKAAAAKK